MSKLNLTRIGFLLKKPKSRKWLIYQRIIDKIRVAAGTISQIETGKTSPISSVYIPYAKL